MDNSVVAVLLGPNGERSEHAKADLMCFGLIRKMLEEAAEEAAEDNDKRMRPTVEEIPLPVVQPQLWKKMLEFDAISKVHPFDLDDILKHAPFKKDTKIEDVMLGENAFYVPWLKTLELKHKYIQKLSEALAYTDFAKLNYAVSTWIATQVAERSVEEVCKMFEFEWTMTEEEMLEREEKDELMQEVNAERRQIEESLERTERERKEAEAAQALAQAQVPGPENADPNANANPGP